MPDRAKRLVYTGQLDSQGEPREWFSFVPPADLNAQQIAQLDDDQYAEITGSVPGKLPLYIDPDKPKPDPLEGLTMPQLQGVAANLNVRIPKDVKGKEALTEFVASEQKRINAELQITTDAVKAAGKQAEDTIPLAPPPPPANDTKANDKAAPPVKGPEADGNKAPA